MVYHLCLSGDTCSFLYSLPYSSIHLCFKHLSGTCSPHIPEPYASPLPSVTNRHTSALAAPALIAGPPRRQRALYDVARGETGSLRREKECAPEPGTPPPEARRYSLNEETMMRALRPQLVTCCRPRAPEDQIEPATPWLRAYEGRRSGLRSVDFKREQKRNS
ncbi:hypothetical protein H920_09888 [Fukomys damarensis]|uniref:Uncharacterized protein n=1 Tax=Fukomys damarensis TaxID=885580 RepID=A0A091D9F0_FUKDA|nr:hypothetical protein H920_09888 [Fukomys damarensis]